MKKKTIILLTVTCLITVAPTVTNTSFGIWTPKSIFAKANTSKAHQNLSDTVNNLANKDDLQSRENNIIQAAQTNDNDTSTSRNTDNSKTTQKDLKNYLNQSKQLTKINEQANKKTKKLKSSLTPADYKKIKNYNKSLNKYIETLQDYASTLESDGAVSSDPNASQSDKQDAQKDINKTRSKFNKAKSNWLASYNSLTQAN